MLMSGDIEIIHRIGLEEESERSVSFEAIEISDIYLFNHNN